jgi:hypothetical protein
MGIQLHGHLVGPLRVRSHLSEGMRIAVLLHTKMAEQLAALRAAVSFAAHSMLGHSPTEALRVDVVDELIAKFWK